MNELLLIKPVDRRTGYLMSQFSTFSPLGLAYVVAATPSNWEVDIAEIGIIFFCDPGKLIENFY